jgi:hypothetical protein
MGLSRKNPPVRAGLLIYFVVVMLLAWWPWNVWLVFGAAYACGLKRREAPRLLTADTGKPAISRTQRIEQCLITRDGLDSSRDDPRIIRDQHFGNPPGESLIDYVTAASRAINDRSIDDCSGVGEWIDTATGEPVSTTGKPKLGQLSRRR